LQEVKKGPTEERIETNALSWNGPCYGMNESQVSNDETSRLKFQLGGKKFKHKASESQVIFFWKFKKKCVFLLRVKEGPLLFK